MLKESRGSQGQRAGHCGVPTFDVCVLCAVFYVVGLQKFGESTLTGLMCRLKRVVENMQASAV